MPRHRQPDPQTVEAIEAIEPEIRFWESEERMLRQQLGLPPVADSPLRRWASQAPVPGSRGPTRARRRGPGRTVSIAVAVILGILLAGLGAAAAPDLTAPNAVDGPDPGDEPPSTHSSLFVAPQDAGRVVLIRDPNGSESVTLAELDGLPVNTHLNLGDCRITVTEKTAETTGCELRMMPAGE